MEYVIITSDNFISLQCVVIPVNLNITMEDGMSEKISFFEKMSIAVVMLVIASCIVVIFSNLLGCSLKAEEFVGIFSAKYTGSGVLIHFESAAPFLCVLFFWLAAWEIFGAKILRRWIFALSWVSMVEMIVAVVTSDIYPPPAVAWVVLSMIAMAVHVLLSTGKRAIIPKDYLVLSLCAFSAYVGARFLAVF